MQLQNESLCCWMLIQSIFHHFKPIIETSVALFLITLNIVFELIWVNDSLTQEEGWLKMVLINVSSLTSVLPAHFQTIIKPRYFFFFKFPRISHVQHWFINRAPLNSLMHTLDLWFCLKQAHCLTMTFFSNLYLRTANPVAFSLYRFLLLLLQSQECLSLCVLLLHLLGNCLKFLRVQVSIQRADLHTQK